MFSVGQKIICVDDNWIRLNGGEAAPVLGNIYTVRSVGYDGLRLVEVVNEPIDYIEGFDECVFASFHFAPLPEQEFKEVTYSKILEVVPIGAQ